MGRVIGAQNMLFKKLTRITTARRQTLPFVHSMEDCDIVMFIGAAQEEGAPLGLKQLALLNLATSSTLQRRLNRLMRDRVIRKIAQQTDGRRIAYLLTPKAIRACSRFAKQLDLGD